MIWGIFAIVAFNLADTYYVGQLGTDRLAAMSFTFPVVMTLGSLPMRLWVGASLVIPMFNSNTEVIAIARTYLSIVPISYGGAGIIQVANSAFNALGKPIPAVIMTVLRMFVLYIPLAYLGSNWLGTSGIFIAATVSNILVGIVAWQWSRRTFIRDSALVEV